MAKRKSSPPADAAPPAATDQEYTVLARRYRPQQFADVVGQEPVARALTNALQSNRVAHAYLFTGARGVGKTSTARILAKALNCVRGPTATPCDQCEICRSIATGEDVDVLEIDGASNRGIDEVREIRQNVQYRPQRARYKIYIIDEVHMLTPPAFNALLKTLEEPPAHVKFIFATTEVQKIPVTILSRCQRFDFAGISTARIMDQLRQVVAGEGVQAEDEALELIARRAGGSMRDAQSLLDQVLAFGGDPQSNRLTDEQVQHLLGMANDDRVIALATPVLEQNPRQALELLRQAVDEGLQLNELLDQLIDYWRDLMVVHCAGAEARDLSVPARHRELLAQQAASVSLDTILAGLDILTTTKARLRTSHHGRVLLEMALVRLGRLTELVPLTQLAQFLGSGGTAGTTGTAKGGVASPARPLEAAPPRWSPPANARPPESPAAQKKKIDSAPAAAESDRPKDLTPATLTQVWPEVLTRVGPLLASHLENVGLAISGPKTLVLSFSLSYNQHLEYCREPKSVARIEEAIRKVTGQTWSVRVESVSSTAAALPAPAAEMENSQSRSRRQRTEAMQAPLVKRAFELLGAQFVQMDEGFGAAPAEPVQPRESPEGEEE
jgi:DNA polymerase-3 subunit gamma/tau